MWIIQSSFAPLWEPFERHVKTAFSHTNTHSDATGHFGCVGDTGGERSVEGGIAYHFHWPTSCGKPWCTIVPSIVKFPSYITFWFGSCFLKTLLEVAFHTLIRLFLHFSEKKSFNKLLQSSTNDHHYQRNASHKPEGKYSRYVMRSDNYFILFFKSRTAKRAKRALAWPPIDSMHPVSWLTCCQTQQGQSSVYEVQRVRSVGAIFVLTSDIFSHSLLVDFVMWI